MGWYGGDTKCPNCGSEKAVEIFRNNCTEGYYLTCVDCGLHLHSEYKQWVVTNSYIDKSIIGKDPQKLNPELIVDVARNEDILPEGSAL